VLNHLLEHGSLTGSAVTYLELTSLFSGKAGEKTLGKTLGVFAGGSLLGGLLGQAEETGDPEGITRNVGALKIKLADAYRNQRTFADAEDEEAAIANKLKEMYLNIQLVKVHMLQVVE
jgi:hypothetical protein